MRDQVNGVGRGLDVDGPALARRRRQGGAQAEHRAVVLGSRLGGRVAGTDLEGGAWVMGRVSRYTRRARRGTPAASARDRDRIRGRPVAAAGSGGARPDGVRMPRHSQCL